MSSTFRPTMSQTPDADPPASDQQGRPQAALREDRAAMHPRDDQAGVHFGDESAAAPRTTRTSGAAAELIRDLTRHAADHGEEVLKFGVQVMTAAQVPLAAAEIVQGHRLFETSSSLLAAYGKAVQSTAGDVRAMVTGFYDAIAGWQKFQQETLSVAARSYHAASDKRRVANATSPAALIEMQREIYAQTIDGVCRAWIDLLASTTKAVEAGSRSPQDRQATR